MPKPLPPPPMPADMDLRDIPMPVRLLVECFQHDFKVTRAEAILRVREVVSEWTDMPDQKRLLAELNELPQQVH